MKRFEGKPTFGVFCAFSLIGMLVLPNTLAAQDPVESFVSHMLDLEPPSEILWEGQPILLAVESAQSFYWGDLIVAFAWREDIECIELEDLISGTPIGYLEVSGPGLQTESRQGAFLLVRQSRNGWELAVVADEHNEVDETPWVVALRERVITEYLSVKYRNCPVAVSPIFESMSADEIDSSFINGAYYDRANGYLLLKLRDTWYHYCGVPEGVWEAFQKAESKGRFYNAHIRGIYDCRVYPVTRYVSSDFYLTDWGAFLTLEWNDLFMMGFIPLDVLAALSDRVH